MVLCEINLADESCHETFNKPEMSLSKLSTALIKVGEVKRPTEDFYTGMSPANWRCFFFAITRRIR
jgi:hypothetical protein